MIASVGAYNHDDHLNPLTYRLVVSPPYTIYPINTHYIDYHLRMNEIHAIDGTVRRFYDFKKDEGSSYSYYRGQPFETNYMLNSFIKLAEYYEVYTQYYDYTPQMFVGGRNLGSSFIEETIQEKNEFILIEILRILAGIGGIFVFSLLIVSSYF